MLVRRQLQSGAHESTGSLAVIGEDTVVENGALQRVGSEDPNADLMNRTNTGARSAFTLPKDAADASGRLQQAALNRALKDLSGGQYARLDPGSLCW